jgi:outer membrane protein assembly factor BamB
MLILIISSCDECTLIPADDTYETGDTLWIHETPVKDSMWIDQSLAIGQNGDIYYAAAGFTISWHPARIFALDPDDGTLKWQSGPIDRNGLGSQIVVGDDGTIFVIGNYKLYALNPDDGSFKWTWEVPQTLPNPHGTGEVYTYGVIGALALTDDGNLILGSVGSGIYNRCLYGIDKNGNKRWHNIDAVAGSVFSGIYIGANNTAYYYTSLGGQPDYYLLAVDVNSGIIKWNTKVISTSNSLNNIAIQDDGNLFCSFKKDGDDKFRYHIVDGGSGNIIWSGTEEGDPNRKWIGPNGTFYGYNWGVYSIDAASGTKNEIVSCEFGSIGSDNHLVCAFTDADFIRKLGVFYPDGVLDYSVNMEGLMGHEILISDDKVIYGIINLHPVSRLPTKICAIQGKAPLADSGWPRPFHDNRNTANWSKH